MGVVLGARPLAPSMMTTKTVSWGFSSSHQPNLGATFMTRRRPGQMHSEMPVLSGKGVREARGAGVLDSAGGLDAYLLAVWRSPLQQGRGVCLLVGQQAGVHCGSHPADTTRAKTDEFICLVQTVWRNPQR